MPPTNKARSNQQSGMARPAQAPVDPDPDDPQYRKSKIQSRRRRYFRRLLLYTAATAATAYLVVIHIVPRFLNLPYQLTHDPPPGLQITDRNGDPLRHFLSGDDLRRDPPADLGEIPHSLIDATLAAEDTRFYNHNGIDYFGVLRAARDAAINRRFVSGASTVSQQLIKIWMAALPIKMALRWMFNLKYLVAIPEYFFNI